ncbi:hypothetical protein GCM10010412_099660 [Nonomuraea recticatena]|uniref:Uncharacterized protein n=1 Tax=Nonomuraea recticatena TaxID=46178 RepID=A0ABP6FVA2_9ACTN
MLDPSLRVHSDLGSSDLIRLGGCVTFGWIDPVAVAYPGQRVWNDFASHRPGTVPAMASALLNGPVDQALDVWNPRGDPICVNRTPGPAGPLYARGANGTHRLHAARLTGLPLI